MAGDPGPHRAEVGRVGVLRSATKDVHASADLDVAESRSLHLRGEFVLGQTAGDAAGSRDQRIQGSHAVPRASNYAHGHFFE